MENQFLKSNAVGVSIVSICSGIIAFYLLSSITNEGEITRQVWIIVLAVIALIAGGLSLKNNTEKKMRFIAIIGILIGAVCLLWAGFLLVSGF